ncbi:MAG: winged helix-turn-helix domain-containing protein [Chloroflexi bacterium]|nr:winged helix-turn-helix domain-containing protein [Chloroflexota bacterium]
MESSTSSLPRRRSLTLLKILLTRYGKPMHREELIDLLWPEADPQSAGALLNVVVHYLRRGRCANTASVASRSSANSASPLCPRPRRYASASALTAGRRRPHSLDKQR